MIEAMAAHLFIYNLGFPLPYSHSIAFAKISLCHDDLYKIFASDEGAVATNDYHRLSMSHISTVH